MFSGRAAPPAKIDLVLRARRAWFAPAPWLLALAVVVLGAPHVSAQSPSFAAVDDAARDAVQSGEIPGAVVLVGRGDDVLFVRAYGWRRIVPDQAPMTVETIFDVASLTKPFGTTLAVMSLVERGAVKLDAPVGRYLPEFRKPAFAQVTIQRLLTHSGGFQAIPPTGSVKPAVADTMKAFARLALDYPPGTGTQYSDMGFIVLGEVVRRVAGQPLDRYLERTVFKPLGLRDTGFHPPASIRDRIASTEWANGKMLVGEVHDPRARVLGGVAGHAGMFSTVGDLSAHLPHVGGRRYAERSPRAQGGHRTAHVDAHHRRQRQPRARLGRLLGVRPLDVAVLPDRVTHPHGLHRHLGLIDPRTASYVLLLTNRVHPNGGGAAKIRELRARVAAAVGATLFGSADLPLSEGDSPWPAADGAVERRSDAPPEPVRTGLDVLARQNFAPLTGYSVGLVTNQTGRDVSGRRAIDLLAAAPGVRLTAIFSPEHGITGDSNTEVGHGRDPITGIPVWSLYGSVKRPTAAMLKDVTLLLFDIQDVGARYYTYLTTLVYVMEEAARHRIPVVVLDRPNPITGRYVEGPLMDLDLASFTAPSSDPGSDRHDNR